MRNNRRTAPSNAVRVDFEEIVNELNGFCKCVQLNPAPSNHLIQLRKIIRNDGVGCSSHPCGTIFQVLSTSAPRKRTLRQAHSNPELTVFGDSILANMSAFGGKADIPS